MVTFKSELKGQEPRRINVIFYLKLDPEVERDRVLQLMKPTHS